MKTHCREGYALAVALVLLACAGIVLMAVFTHAMMASRYAAAVVTRARLAGAAQSVIEMYKGQPNTSVKVTVRPLPFLHRDSMGDKWMYVSSTKRIPLPDDLFKDGKPDVPAIRSWHERIVRMNPELKGVTFEMIQKAFNDFA